MLMLLMRVLLRAIRYRRKGRRGMPRHMRAERGRVRQVLAVFVNMDRSMRSRGACRRLGGCSNSYGVLDCLRSGLVGQLGRHVHRLEVGIGRFRRREVIREVCLRVRRLGLRDAGALTTSWGF